MVRSNVVRLAHRAKFYAFGVAFALTVFLLGGVPSYAQGTTGGSTGFVDYGALATTSKTELGSAVGAFVPTVLSIVISMVAIGLLIKWLRRAPKAS